MTYIIDRFEGSYAICEDEHGSFISIERNKLPASVREGDIVIKQFIGYKIDKSTTEKRKKSIQALAKDIWKD